MDYRDDREALRARLEAVEEELQQTKEELRQSDRERMRRLLSWCLRGLCVAMVVALVVSFSLFVRWRSSGVSAPPPRPSASADAAAAAAEALDVRVHGLGELMFGDVDHDGVLDALFWTQCSQQGRSPPAAARGPQSGAVAFDVRTGKPIWSNCNLGDRMAYNQMRSAVIDSYLIGDSGGTLYALRLADGQLAWTRNAQEPTKRFCSPAAGVLHLETDGGRWFVVDLATGELTTSPAVSECRPLWVFDKRFESIQLPGQSFGRKVRGVGLELPVLDGVVAGLSLSYEDRTVVLGFREPGERVPVAVSRVGETEMWRSDVPGQDVVGAGDGTPPVAALTWDRLVVPYHRVAANGGGWRLACLDVGTGRRIWESPLGGVGQFAAIAIVGGRVFVDHGSKEVFQLEDGRRLYELP